jgi:hypothetical protein
MRQCLLNTEIGDRVETNSQGITAVKILKLLPEELGKVAENHSEFLSCSRELNQGPSEYEGGYCRLNRDFRRRGRASSVVARVLRNSSQLLVTEIVVEGRACCR